MINELVNYFKDKKVLILGFGAEGQSTYRFIRKYGGKQTIYIADQKEKFYENSILAEDKQVVCIEGEHYLDNLEQYDVIMKAPGISLLGRDISNYREKIKSQLEVLLEFSNAYTIGITGTKGKSTTSSLIYQILLEQGKDVLLLGNIGTPILDYAEEINKDKVLVLEMSSHQLEYTEMSPNIAILLNIYEEHLDHYGSLEKYAEAKCHIFQYQKERDNFLYNAENELLVNCLKKYGTKAKKCAIANKKVEQSNMVYCEEDQVYWNGRKIYDATKERKLLGKHNLMNIMFALGVSQILGLEEEKTIETITHFEPLPHRMEYVGKYDDVLYYNDSIATVPEATISTIEALKEISTLIIGGMDRGVNLDNFASYLEKSKIENIICLPKTGHDVGEQISNSRSKETKMGSTIVAGNKKIYFVETLQEAVEIAKRVTAKETICALSPAAASYGFFKNFKERGELFKKLVKQGDGASCPNTVKSKEKDEK